MLPVLDPSRESRIDNAGQISHVVFEVSMYDIYDHARFADRNTCQVVLGLFCGIAVVTIIVRLAL